MLREPELLRVDEELRDGVVVVLSVLLLREGVTVLLSFVVVVLREGVEVVLREGVVV